jgi:diguanylate cyclase (GGDEF)-like protein
MAGKKLPLGKAMSHISTLLRRAGSRVRAIAQGSTLLSLIMIGLIWVGVDLHLKGERIDHERQVVQNSANLTRAFEEHLSRSLNDIDRSLRAIREQYLLNPLGFDLREWLKASQPFDEATLQVGVIDPRGFLKLSSVDSPTSVGTDLRDRKHFRHFIEATDDRLYISAPVIGRTTGKWSIQLARRIETKDGSFAGVIAASLDPNYLSRFYDSVDLGKDSYIRIIGVDGIVRAVGGWTSETLSKDFSATGLFKHFREQPTGWYYAKGGSSDHIQRLVSYRKTKDYPLIVTTGLSTAEIFSGLYAEQDLYHAAAAALTVIILIVNGFTIRGRLLREKIARDLEVQNFRLNALLADMPLGVCMFDNRGQLAIANEYYRQMYALKSETIVPGVSLNEIVRERERNRTFTGDVNTFCDDLVAQLDRGLLVKGTSRLSDGRVIASVNQPMEDGGWVSIHEDITGRDRAEAKIAYMAHHDPLTGLLNRARYTEILEEALAGLQCAQVAVFFLDLDFFKNVNDTLGHLVGDELLKAVADRLRSCLTAADTVARLGGDEFAIIHTGIEDRQDAAVLADAIRAAVTAPYDLGGPQAVVDVSIGIALSPQGRIAAAELMKQADMALYRAKGEGRGAYRFFDPEMNARNAGRRALETSLRSAITNDEFELFYQPVVNIEENRVVGLEALLRWHHPERGLLSPADFIPVAVETGLIVPLGEWVLRRACADAAHWPDDIKLAVNLSPAQFSSRTLAETVTNALAASGVVPSRLELEITEEIVLGHSRDNLAVLDKLRAMGVQIVMDDFGTGYSSLNYLRLFPFDKIKIDRSFVKDLSRGDGLSLAIIQAVAGFAGVLGVPATAEGVETKEQLDLVRVAGCTEYQGYLFARPRPIAELAHLLDASAPTAASAA